MDSEMPSFLGLLLGIKCLVHHEVDCVFLSISYILLEIIFIFYLLH